MRNFPLVLVQYCYSFILVLVLGGWGSRSRTSLVLDQNWLSWRDDLETKTVEFTEALDGPGHFLWHSLILLQLRSWSWRAAKLLMKCITKILASCGIVWGMKAGCWLRYYHCHHHSHASDPTRWAIGITCHNVGRFSTMKGFFLLASKSGLHGFAPTMTAICKPPVSMGAMDAPGCWRQRSDNWSRAK